MNINTQFAYAPFNPLPAAPATPSKTEQVSTRPAEKPSRSSAPVNQEQEKADAAAAKSGSEAARPPADEVSRDASAPAAEPGKLLDVTV